MTEQEAAWLAGFWDGEGSVGIVRSKTTLILNAQLSHTERGTVTHILALLASAGILGRGYTYQERDPKRHRNAHYIRITGVNSVQILANRLLPYAVTKRRHWQIAIEWAVRRIAVAGGIDAKGHLFRGRSASERKYTDIDHGQYEELRRLNRRGPDDRAARFSEGRICVS